MNRKAAELGMKSTHFNNTHGLPSDGHQTTARDLAHLAFAAFQAAASSAKSWHAAARLHARLGVRLPAQHRVEEHEPIAEDRGLRRHKDRHDRTPRATALFPPASATAGG